MGFGWLLFGYIITFFMSLSYYGWAFRICGYILMGLGCYKLKQYFPRFIYSIWCLAALELSGVVEAVTDIIRLSGAENTISVSISNIGGAVRTVLILVLHIVLLLTIRSAALSVSLDRQAISSVTSLVAVCIGYAVYILAAVNLLPAGLPLLIQIVWSLLVALLIFSCYRKICPEGDENMDRHRTGVPLIDLLGDKFDRAEEKLKAENEEKLARIAERSAEKQRKTRKKRKG